MNKTTLIDYFLLNSIKKLRASRSYLYYIYLVSIELDTFFFGNTIRRIRHPLSYL